MLFLKQCLNLLDELLFTKRVARFQVDHKGSSEYKSFQEKVSTAETVEWSNEQNANNELDNKCTAAVQRHEIDTNKKIGDVKLKLHDIDKTLKITAPKEVPNKKYPASAKKAYEQYVAAKQQWEQDQAAAKAQKELLDADRKRLEDEHAAVKASMESMRDVAKHKAAASIRARESAKKTAADKITSILEEKGVKLDDAAKKKLADRLEKAKLFEEGGDIDYLEGTHTAKDAEGKERSVRITEHDLQNISQWMLVGYEGEDKDFHKIFRSDMVSKAKAKEGAFTDEGQHMGDIQTLAIQYGGFEGKQLSGAWDIVQDLALNKHALGSKTVGMLYGRLASAREGNREEVLAQVKKQITMLKKMTKGKSAHYFSNEKIMAMFEAFDDIEVQGWNDAMAEYEGLKKIVGKDGKTALAGVEAIIKDAGESKHSKIAKATALRAAIKSAEGLYRSTLMTSVVTDKKYQESRKVYEYYGLKGKDPVGVELSKYKTKDYKAMSLAEYKGFCVSLQSLIAMGSNGSPELRTAVATKRDEMNKKIAEIKTYQDVYKQNEKLLTRKKAKVKPVEFAGKLSAATDPAAVKTWYEANKAGVDKAHKEVTGQKDELMAATKKPRYGGGGGRPQRTPSSAPQKTTAEVLAKAKAEWKKQTEVPKDYDVKKPKDRPTWLAESDEKEKTKAVDPGYYEVKRGDSTILAHVEKKDQKVEIKYYEKKAA